MTTKHLATSEVWSFEVPHAGLALRVLAGTVWLTQEADREDHVLEGPATFVADRRGRLAVEAITAAVVELDGAADLGLRRAA